MRDFKNGGDINGNVTINEVEQVTYKSLDQCTPEELRQEYLHRESLAQQERKRINRFAFFFIKIAIVVGIALSIWYAISGNFNNAMFMIGLAGIGMPVAIAIKTGEQKTEFELRQLNTMRYIKTRLREIGQ